MAMFFFPLFSCTFEPGPQPKPVGGILDLRQWNFKTDGNVGLRGEWDFAFDGLLTSAAFDTLTTLNAIKVPGVWKQVNGHSTGFASYRLKILMPPGEIPLSMHIQDMGTAYEVFANGSLVAAIGRVGRSQDESVPALRPQTVEINDVKDSLSLVVWISNYHYRKGGMWKEITLGDRERIKSDLIAKNALLLFISGVWFMVSFTLLCFFLYRTKEKTILYLFLWAFSLLIRQITADDRILASLFPVIPFEWLVKLEMISGFLIAPFAIMSMSYLLPVQFSRKVAKSILGVFLLFVITVVFTCAFFYTHLVVPFEIVSIIALAYACQRIGIAIIRKEEGAAIMGLAFALVLCMYIVQILFYNNLIRFQFGSMSVMAGFVFAFAQIILLAKLFSGALKRVENFASELEQTVEIRTKELVSAQEQLIEAARQSENEKLRRRISRDIHDDISSGLNKISWMGELAKVKAQRNKSDEMNAALDKIIKSARETVDHLVEIIWSLNPRNDNLENLLVYMRNYANNFFEDSRFNVIIDFPGQTGKTDLNPELKRNIFLVMKEAIHNAAKYSEAENIELRFHSGDNKFQFLISDDGCGMEEGVIMGTGNGMINMKKRMEDVGCSFIVDSSPGRGTRIKIEGLLY